MHDLPFLIVLSILTGLCLYLAKHRGGLLAWMFGGLLLLLGGIVCAFACTGYPGFGFMRLSGWTLLVFFPAYLILAGCMIKGLPRKAGMGMGVIILSLSVYAFKIEPGLLTTTYYVIESPKIQKTIRIVSLADIQTDHIGDYERQALVKAKALNADLVVFPGDYIQAEGNVRSREGEAFNQLLKEMSFAPRLGSFAVEGDMEIEGWPRLFEGTGIQTMTTNTVIDLRELELVGLSLEASRRGASLLPREKYRVVFGHAPDFALEPMDADLLLAGHTHGGQVRIPFVGPLITLSAVPRDWADGGLIKLEGGRHLIVSRGIGHERGGAPRLRFNCKPEIVVVDLVPEDAGTQ